MGGPFSADDFLLFVDDILVSCGVATQLDAGVYTVSESDVPTYTASFGGACNASGQVTLTAGAQATCVITNTFVPPVGITQTLTVNKVVVGGPFSADDFLLFVDDTPVSRGVATQLDAGVYTVSESDVPTYTASFGGACNASGKATLASGAHATCVITNTFVPTPPQPGTVQGKVFEDLNGNRQMDAGEGLEGVTVTLQREAGVADTFALPEVTDASGAFEFAGVPAGDFTLRYVLPAGYVPLADEKVTVAAGQTVEVAARMAVKEEPDGPDDVYLPVLRG